jgi:hypothetical protein
VRFQTLSSLLVASVAVLQSCSSTPKTLTRAKAQEIIAASQRFKEPRTYPFILDKDLAMLGNEGKGIVGLASTGYTTLFQHPNGNVDVSLTEKGQKAVDEQKWRIGPIGARPRALFVPVAQPQIVEITGVLAGAGLPAELKELNTTSAEFTWKYTLTPVGESIAKQGFSFAGSAFCCPWDFTPNTVVKGEALFQLYDDGWRMTDISPLELKPDK